MSVNMFVGEWFMDMIGLDMVLKILSILLMT